MNRSIEKKLLHFYTAGSIYEDFSAARSARLARLRRVIRACFYAHLAAAVVSIAAAVLLNAGLGIVGVAASEVVLAALAFMSVGDMTVIKTLLYCGDLVFAAAMTALGVFSQNGLPYFIAGGVSVLMALIALAAFFAAACKSFLENFSPLRLKRDNYTLIPGMGNVEYEDLLEPADDVVITLPPERSEFQQLSDKLREILCPKKEGAEDDTFRENTVSETEVTQ